jgi:hypothetical protein
MASLIDRLPVLSRPTRVILRTMKELGSAEALHGFTIPVFIRTLENMSKILAMAERHARRHRIAPETLLSARLYPNMYTLLQQLQYLCFLPVDFAQHFSSAAAPRVGYDEKTLDELKKSFRQTLRYLRRIKPDQFKGHEQRLLPLFVDASKGLPADALAQRLILPDFFFHTTVAYAILRHIGVPLGKADFLGPLDAVRLRKSRRG